MGEACRLAKVLWVEERRLDARNVLRAKEAAMVSVGCCYYDQGMRLSCNESVVRLPANVFLSFITSSARDRGQTLVVSDRLAIVAGSRCETLSSLATCPLADEAITIRQQ